MSVETIVDLFTAFQRTAAVKAGVELATTDAADAYTFAELEGMFRNAGFARTELRELTPTAERVVIAYRSS